MSAYSANMQGKFAQQQGQFNAQIAEQNGELNRIRAAQTVEIGAIEEQKQRANVRTIMGSQRARMAASGAEVGSGSFGTVLDQTAMFGEEDAQTIRLNAMRNAWGYKMGAVNDMAQATGSRIQGDAARATGRANAIGTLITGGTNLYASSQGGWDKVWSKSGK